jgi:hypothetical protein
VTGFSVFLCTEGHLPRPFAHILPLPSIPSVYAGAGFGRNSSIRRRISRNSFLGTATSANWNVTYRPWPTTFAADSPYQQGIHVR